MKMNISTFIAAALAVGLLATGAQARGGGGFGGGHGGGFGGGMHMGGFGGSGYHGGMITGRSASVPGGNHMFRHDPIRGYPLGCSYSTYNFQNGCY